LGMFRRAPGRILWSLALGVALCPARTTAQAGSAVAGTLAGAAEGTYLSLALATAAARAGHYVFTPRQALWQLTPIPLAAIAGGTLGYHDADRLRDAVRYGLAGFAAGAVAGSVLGSLVGDDRESTWAGAIVGSGAGLLVGSLWGALRDPGGDGDTTLVPVINLSIPFAP
jgi:hypothetical protein